MKDSLSHKYVPATIESLPYDDAFKFILQKLIAIDILKVVLVGNETFSKNMIINTIIKSLNLSERDVLNVNNFKDQGVSNIRYEIKLFSQTTTNHKRLLVIEDIETYSDNIQKLFINNIDKWSQNINIIVTCNNIYNVDESLVSRLFPIAIPNIDEKRIYDKMNEILTAENIQVDDTIKEFIVSICDNNLQTMYHILEKCAFLKSSITLDALSRACTIIHSKILHKYFELLRENNVWGAYNHLLQVLENGYSVIDVLNELYFFVKTTDILSEKEKYSCFKIISDYIVTFITIHEEELELLVFTNDLTSIL
jgi:DNA polymerase III delta prime subunit